MCLINSNTSTIYLTDGGLETDLIFNKHIDLPHFAAFPLLENPHQKEILKSYYIEYLQLAKTYKTGFILESPTWRANTDWGYTLGYSKEDLIRINKLAIKELKTLKAHFSNHIHSILISGQIGPRGDAYNINEVMTSEAAAEYHLLQVKAFKEVKTDMVTAITMNNVDEALGIVYAAKTQYIPVVISFTVETDGNLPSGESLAEAINTIDNGTNTYPKYYMINCAHPTHFLNKITSNSTWKSRIKGIRANASCKSHAELDQYTTLDKGNKEELGQWYISLKKYLPNLKIFGGCCGTDASHVKSICTQILS
ncbi:homocysteine S-methyltransferase family protein [Hyunsoonleella pacifica]|uniref:Homocysteine S-methyltransferase n=1 Tax=Hyunsoonleella pacifica TaxID=1080224 RepID=A0A4V2JAY2_9FLAO|nr:homocysteine S-methyltransferase family protein [Hyunsoonleella pacifica]TBN15595.1 homocysteine S-methyltransferase [Hyunsoonleella pacifica]GGD21161.1 homocysteine S-methyltransferase [Hyunsoonleella pacifica]